MKSFVFGAANALRKFAPYLRAGDPKGISIPSDNDRVYSQRAQSAEYIIYIYIYTYIYTETNGIYPAEDGIEFTRDRYIINMCVCVCVGTYSGRVRNLRNRKCIE